VIFKSALFAAAAMALVAILTGKDVVRTRRITLNNLQYNVTLFSNTSMEVEREDGLRFSLNPGADKPTLLVGTQAQLDDAMLQLKESVLAQLREAA
jgi:cytochrome oxidase Cu insertion factor (SCO1/SenC/PrrC family)